MGLLQREVAERIGVKEESIYNWENNRSQPKIHLIPGIIKFLGYIPFRLLNGTFAEKLLAFRKTHGFSQRKAAKLLGVDQTTLRDWENGKHKPSRKLKEEISKIIERDS